ncbi:uncharacterized protein EI97DRAFT_439202 [Westerdykella ornata]|uniref:Uncharacterized protein n=1 Tax=Westerdykella ornata TaxID=318751 RepID=A0A6A6JUS5_WESOR|nr:uncharacterized protein EI97DRAFT_439202 [Westerdykella ornata]KAF2280137.1 hypothetical protein EI97DRAFT_439202 [Westerdykella ornata]
MQTKTVLASLLFAAIGTQAAPSVHARQADSIPLNIYEGDGCNRGPPITTANVPTDGSCFAFSPILSSQTDSARIDAAGSLPAGCTLTIFNTNNCSPNGNNVPIRSTGNCATFGAGNPLDPFIRAARVSGTC